MRMSEGTEWALHTCLLLTRCEPGESLPASALAEFHDLPQAYLTKHLQALVRAGVLRSAPGIRGGFGLARPAGQISVLDVVTAVEGSEGAFRCAEIRQRGPVAMPANCYRSPCVIAQAMRTGEEAWRKALAKQTLADIAERTDEANSGARRRAERWLADRRPMKRTP